LKISERTCMKGGLFLQVGREEKKIFRRNFVWAGRSQGGGETGSERIFRAK